MLCRKKSCLVNPFSSENCEAPNFPAVSVTAFLVILFNKSMRASGTGFLHEKSQ